MEENSRLKWICVYCGARDGAREAYVEAARALAEALVESGIGLIYGGASVGVMGALADAVLDAGGDVIGVMPRTLSEREVSHPRLGELRIVESMHERKAQMESLADAFIALPGGLGTLDELFEILTWAQLGLHAKPCGLLNAAGYFDPLIAFLDHAEREGFVSGPHRRMLAVSESAPDLLDALDGYRAPRSRHWMSPTQI